MKFRWGLRPWDNSPLPLAPPEAFSAPGRFPETAPNPRRRYRRRSRSLWRRPQHPSRAQLFELYLLSQRGKPLFFVGRYGREGSNTCISRAMSHVLRSPKIRLRGPSVASRQMCRILIRPRSGVSCTSGDNRPPRPIITSPLPPISAVGNTGGQTNAVLQLYSDVRPDCSRMRKSVLAPFYSGLSHRNLPRVRGAAR